MLTDQLSGIYEERYVWILKDNSVEDILKLAEKHGVEVEPTGMVRRCISGVEEEYLVRGGVEGVDRFEIDSEGLFTVR